MHGCVFLWRRFGICRQLLRSLESRNCEGQTVRYSENSRKIRWPANLSGSENFLVPENPRINKVSNLYSFIGIYERFEPRSHFKRLSLIVRVNVVLNRTVVVDSDWRFDNLCDSHLQSQSELYYVSWWYYTLVIDLIGQLRHDVIRLSVKPWCYWLWRLVITNYWLQNGKLNVWVHHTICIEALLNKHSDNFHTIG